MNFTSTYINSLPISASAKWTLRLICDSEKKLVTRKGFHKRTGVKMRTVRLHFEQFLDLGIITKRQQGWQVFYYLKDIRLVHNIAADKKNFQPIS